MSHNKKEQPGFMLKTAGFIVKKRAFIFLFYIFALIFSMFSIGWVNVENDVTVYLPEDTETRLGLVAMNENFKSFASAQVMLSNVTWEEAKAAADEIATVKGITMVTFDRTPEHYKNAAVLLDISFAGGVMRITLDCGGTLLTAVRYGLDTSVKNGDTIRFEIPASAAVLCENDEGGTA